MKPCSLHNLLAVVAPCWVKVPHVTHLVVLAHVQNSMTTSILRSSEGCRSRPLETGVSAARRRSYGGKYLNPSTSYKQGDLDEGEIRERKRPEKIDLNSG